MGAGKRGAHHHAANQTLLVTEVVQLNAQARESIGLEPHAGVDGAARGAGEKLLLVGAPTRSLTQDDESTRRLVGALDQSARGLDDAGRTHGARLTGVRVIECPAGAICVDTLQPFTNASAQALASYTIPGTRSQASLVGRYLENLTIAEIGYILTAGHYLWLIGESRPPGWMPSAQTGDEDGAREVARLAALGIPTGPDVVCDLEGPSAQAVANDIASYSAAWYAQVNGKAKSRGSVYHGYGLPCDPAQMYALPFTLYWRSDSNDTSGVAVADYAAFQTFPEMTLALPTGDLLVDLSIIARDKKGRGPMVLAA